MTRRAAFTLIELMVSMALGVLVAGGAVFGLRQVIMIDQRDRVQHPSWLSQADQLLYQDLQQASLIESTARGVVIFTTTSADLNSDKYHSRSVISYEIVNVRDRSWWVRAGKPEVALSNKKHRRLLLCPSEGVRLHISLPGVPPLIFGENSQESHILGSWEIEDCAPAGAFEFDVSTTESNTDRSSR